jgi:hypothetical protein
VVNDVEGCLFKLRKIAHVALKNFNVNTEMGRRFSISI